jgi:hypothetical protein
MIETGTTDDLLLRAEAGHEAASVRGSRRCHFEDLSNVEAAQVLGTEPAAAGKRSIRALRRLKAILDAVPGFFP